MEENEQPDIIYSEPVNEIMGHPPGKILRWGTAIILVIFILFVLLLWLIKYPDTIPAPVEITTANPPVTLVSKLTGRIKNLYVRDKEETRKGEVLAVMETTASIDEINRLKEIVDTISNPEPILLSFLPEFTELGEIQSYWGSFMKSLSDFNNYNINDFYGNKIISLTEEIDGICIHYEYIEMSAQMDILEIHEANFTNSANSNL